MVKVGCIITTIFLALFLINLQYLLFAVKKYEARLMNHKGDLFYFGLSALAAIALLLVKKVPGEPLANGLPVVPF
jgi:hypothetical protein